MPFRSRRLLVALALAALPLAASACGGGGGSPSSAGAVVSIDTPSGQASSPVIVPRGLSVGSAALPDVSATATTTFALAPAHGHLNLVFFGYTNCPDVCPGTMRAVDAALLRLGQRAADVSLAMVSVDPKRDTATRLRSWVSSLVTSGRGHGLRTADAAELSAVEKRLGIVAQPYEDGDFEYIEHTGGLFAVAPGGSVVAEWPYGVDPATLATDIGKLLDGRGVKSA